ncbi:MAG TPA: signal recognition particle-docking protein FtsY [Rhodospirillaceae bacterium]|nr:signal recognition particle-docking protein FtsY [Rhodospirillaceae bacterium]
MSSKSWLGRLRDGLAKSTNKLTGGIAFALTRRRLDDEALEELEDTLVMADMGPATAARLVADLGEKRFEKDIETADVQRALAALIADILKPVALPLVPDSSHKPHVILIAGVNGSGKTTTIGKLAKTFTDAGKKVMLAAGDTFRAAAIEQLQVWGDRTGSTVVTKEAGADAAGLAFEALEKAQGDGTEILLIDTAGRLHNKADLMAELEKIVRVLKKLDGDAPHECVLVLDATTGQNALAQVETFQESAPVSGLIVTKLDGSAKGGVLVALADKFGLPVHAIGVGESAEDLQPFEAGDFAESLVGLADEA